VLGYRGQLAALLRERGERQEAAAECEAALRSSICRLGEDHPVTRGLKAIYATCPDDR
jgi:Tetratricopeptide repeat